MYSNGVFTEIKVSGQDNTDVVAINNFGTIFGYYSSWDSFGSVVSSGQFIATPSATPESTTWVLMMVGVGAMGAALRTRRRKVVD